MQTILRSSSRAAVVLLVCLCAPACGLRQQPNLTPEQLHQAQLRDLQRVAQVTERVGTLVQSLQAIEITLFQAGRVPRDTHIQIQTWLIATSDYVLQSLEQAKDQTRSVQSRRDGILFALRQIDRLQTEIVEKIPDEAARARLSGITLAISTLLTVWSLMT